MNENWDFKPKYDYDRDADVLYVSLGTGKPSFIQEVDDIILIERALDTHEITGFRIMNLTDTLIASLIKTRKHKKR